ncbi:MAG: polysaccharide deacetylase family protein [Zoogloea sp.]|nr:polysaccharide deacetylase family protein [Zoogloea sp.]
MPIPILMYHQIDATPPRGTPMRGLTVTPGSFARQMRLLKLLGYRGMSMSDLEPYLRGERQGKVVGITFDDGYLNNLEHALPILQRIGFTATCYAVSDPFEGRNAWDESIGIPQKPLMNAGHLRAWAEGGMEVGAHTRHHAELTKVDDAIALDEIAGCKHELEAMLGREVRHFCYPYGHYTAVHREMVRAAGFATATTVERSRARPEDDLFELPRVMVARHNHLLLFWSRIAFGYEDPRK